MAMAPISFFKSFFKRASKPRKADATRPPAERMPEVVQSKKPVAVSTSVSRHVVLTPLVSEKGVDRQRLKQVVFRVSRTATKGQIAQAVQEQYRVRPIKVRTIRMHPKRRRRGRSEGFTAQWKKAYVAVEDLKPFNVTP